MTAEAEWDEGQAVSKAWQQAVAEAERRGAERALRETCREWPIDGDRCNAPAEFILWGKLFPPDALGPRCYDHAVKHTGHNMPARVDQWAVFDLRARAYQIGAVS